MKPLLLFLLFSQITVTPPEAEVVPVLRVPCRIVEVVDGDTVTVEITLQARVRLLDCWAPERGTPEGAKATDYVRRIAHDRAGILEVNLSSLRRLDDAFSFGRILARIYLDGTDLSERIVRAGHATARRSPGRHGQTDETRQ